MTSRALDYVGALGENPENHESLEFHTSLLIGQVASLDEVHAYHRAYPWRTIEALDHSSWTRLLQDMESMWNFVLEVPDKLRDNEPLWRELMVTRYQPFRDVFIKCEHLISMHYL